MSLTDEDWKIRQPIYDQAKAAAYAQYRSVNLAKITEDEFVLFQKFFWHKYDARVIPILSLDASTHSMIMNTKDCKTYELAHWRHETSKLLDKFDKSGYIEKVEINNEYRLLPEGASYLERKFPASSKGYLAVRDLLRSYKGILLFVLALPPAIIAIIWTYLFRWPAVKDELMKLYPQIFD